MTDLPEVGSVWKMKSADDYVKVLDVKKRGRGYQLVTSFGIWRLKDFQRNMESRVDE